MPPVNLKELDALKMHFGQVYFSDKTEETLTLVGFSVLTKKAVQFTGVTWECLQRWVDGDNVQDCGFPSEDCAEFMISGFGPGDWEQVMPPEDEG